MVQTVAPSVHYLSYPPLCEVKHDSKLLVVCAVKEIRARRDTSRIFLAKIQKELDAGSSGSAGYIFSFVEDMA
jgi:hypothetical protein